MRCELDRIVNGESDVCLARLTADGSCPYEGQHQHELETAFEMHERSIPPFMD